MCADPKMRTALLAELRQELAARKNARGRGFGVRASQLVILVAACVVVIAIS